MTVLSAIYLLIDAPATVALLSELTAAVTDRSWLLVPLVLAGSYLLAKFVHWGSRTYLERTTDVEADSRTSLGRAIFEEIHTPLSLSIALIGIYFSLDILDLLETGTVVVGTLLTALTLIWVRTAVRIGNRWIEYIQAKETTYEFAPMFKNLWTIGSVLTGALLLLSIWDLEVTPFLASAGIIGIVVGFAAQEAIANLIGGTALYFDNTYKMGDVIRVEDDMRGTVTDIGIRSTTVLTPDNRLVSVPNAVLNSNQVVNETAPRRHVRIHIPLSTAYGTDYTQVEQIALDVCKEAKIIRDSPPPQVLFLEFGDSALEFELRAYINHPLAEKRALDRINRRIYDRFTDAGIVIPFPQRELSFLEEGTGTEHQFRESLEETEEQNRHS